MPKTPTPPKPAVKLPEDSIKAVGLCATKDGHMVLLLTLEEGTVVNAEVITGPGPKAVAIEQLKLTVVRRLMWPAGD